MKIGILQTAYKKSADYGAFYNVQELGLARALAKLGHEVSLYKAVDGEGIKNAECDGRLTVNLIPVKYIGINGLVDPGKLDKSIEVLIYFSDIQIKVPAVYKWCLKNGVKFIPYVGVIESHSENKLKRRFMNFMAKRNLDVYKKCTVLAKTPAMKQTLSELECRDVRLFSVGLDESVMAASDRKNVVAESGAETASIASLDQNEQVIKHSDSQEKLNLLFIGRMEEEKQPLEMVRLFDETLSVNPSLKLTMIGDGYMYDRVASALDEVKKKHSLTDDRVSLIRKVPYNEMHTYYEEADIYINLNQVEILGMSILEAMYYNCPVLAISAPGPEFILKISAEKDLAPIGNGIGEGRAFGLEESEYCGMLAPDMEALAGVLNMFAGGQIERNEIDRLTNLAGERVRSQFVWTALGRRLIKIIEELDLT